MWIVIDFFCCWFGWFGKRHDSQRSTFLVVQIFFNICWKLTDWTHILLRRVLISLNKFLYTSYDCTRNKFSLRMSLTILRPLISFFLFQIPFFCFKRDKKSQISKATKLQKGFFWRRQDHFISFPWSKIAQNYFCDFSIFFS
jgi:hypothetical protein